MASVMKELSTQGLLKMFPYSKYLASKPFYQQFSVCGLMNLYKYVTNGGISNLEIIVISFM